MSGLLAVLYTSLGGVFGAGLTQYVTHVRDRRAARALVIERLAEVEETYGTLRWPVTDETPYSSSRIAKQLGLLEAAALIAGMPKSVIICYVISCRYVENTQRISHGATLLGKQIAAEISSNLDDIKALPNFSEIPGRLSHISENIKLIFETIKQKDQSGFKLHDASLSLLGKALWHPILFQLNVRRLQSLRKSANSLTSQIQQLSNLLQQMHSLFDQTAPGNFLVPRKPGRPSVKGPPVAAEPVET